MSASALYTGQVSHLRPGKHRLRYRVFMLALALDEISAIDARLRLFSHNRFNLVALFDCDHGDRRNEAIQPQIEAKLRAAGLDCEGGRIILLTIPRLLNYAFNPLSIYFCYRQTGELAALAHEVSNTFGERHFYILPAMTTERGTVAQACEKSFFVSPFLEMDLRYEFEVTAPGERCVINMTVRRGEDLALAASFAGERRELSDAGFVRAFVGDPLMTFKVIAGIHWEALKMWLKGVRYLGRGRCAESVPTAATTPAGR